MIKLYFQEIENAKSYSESFALKILSEYLNVDEKSLVVLRDRFGKPYLKDYPETHFNISHTKGAIVCAVSDKQVGIDIEGLRKVNYKIAEKYFTEAEKEYIFSEVKGQDDRFIEVWTKKEAYVKWVGRGMEIPLDSFDTIGMDNVVSFMIWDFFVSLCSEYLI